MAAEAGLMFPDVGGSRPGTAPAFNTMVDTNSFCSELSMYQFPSMTPGGYAPDASNSDDLLGRYSLRAQTRDRDSLRSSQQQRVRDTLFFKSFFREAVGNSSVESERVRHCTVKYFLHDDTMEFSEHKQVNSGMPQGKIVRRHQIPRPAEECEDGNVSYYGLADMVIGNTLTVYGKRFTIVDCDPYTRKYMREKLNVEQGPAVDPPEDEFTAMMRRKMRTESGMDTNASYGRQSNDLYGNAAQPPVRAWTSVPRKNRYQLRAPSGTRDWLTYSCVWDDRDQMFGSVARQTAHFFLDDETLEIVQAVKKNSIHTVKVLRRVKVPREAISSQVEERDGDGQDGFVTVRDLRVGTRLNINGRLITIIDADAFTRQYAADQGVELGEGRAAPDPRPKYKLEIPPYNGYGSEADSLQTCSGSLIPRQPRKLVRLDDIGKVVRFGVELLSGDPKSRRMRRFVLNYFVEDNTIAIRELVRKNSGFTGGQFLSRREVSHPTENRKLTTHDLYVGAEVQIFKHRFRLSNADEFSLRYMEDHCEVFPASDVSLATAKLFGRAQDVEDSCSKQATPEGTLDKADLSRAIQNSGVDVSTQEMITFIRALISNRGQNGRVSLDDVHYALSDADWPAQVKAQAQRGAGEQNGHATNGHA